MNDLAVLFPTDRDQERDSPLARPDAAELRRLVGEGPSRGEPISVGLPRDLSSVIGPKDPAPVAPTVDLSSLLGEDSSPVRSSAGSADLAALVGTSAGRADDRGWVAPELAQAGRRPLFGGRRKAGAVNYLSVAAAAIAIFALVGTASFAVVQRATANPADEAMVSLGEREAELRNDTNVLQTAADLYVASVSDAQALADTSAATLTGLQGRIDATPLAAAGAARASLASAASASLPVAVPEYRRASFDEKSFADVAQAIDDVRLAREALPALLARVRDARAGIVSSIDSFRTELRNVGAAIDAAAGAEVAKNDAAADSFRDAVRDAAAAVRTAQLAGGDGLAEMPAFASALDALRAENTRVLELRAAEEEDERSRTPQRESDPPSRNQQQPSNPQPSDPPTTEPTTPPTPEPTPDPTTEPTPEPEPEPQPPSTEPPSNGGTGESP